MKIPQNCHRKTKVIFFTLVAFIGIFVIQFWYFEIDFRFYRQLNPEYPLAAVKTFRCDEYPKVPQALQLENELWQVLQTSDGTFKMFNAYFDEREAVVNGSVVRILAFINRVDPTVRTFCQFWFEGIESPVIVESHEYKLLWHRQWGMNIKGSQPHLIACRYPLKNASPASVSLVENECDLAGNNLKVIRNTLKFKQKQKFGICVKDLDFMDDQSIQIIEWIEILSILGAEKFFIYVIKVHPNVMRVLQYYQTMGKVEIEKMTEPIGLPNRTQSLTQWLQNELISLNDCLYKHMYEFNFLSPLDIDEIIVPTLIEDKSWNDLMNRIMKSQENIFTGYILRNVFFLSDNNHEGEIQPEVPRNMQFLQHIYRAQNFSNPGVGAKAFQNTQLVLAMHNHYPMKCLKKDYCEVFDIPMSFSQLSHYRRDCENYPKEECQSFKLKTVKDLSLWKWKDKVIENFNKTMKALESFESD